MTTAFSPEEVANFERTVWSRCAERYTNTFGVLADEAVPALLDAANVTDGSRVLDVGTGPGNAAAAARERGGVVIGIDFSTAMIAEGRQQHPEVEFQELSADDLPYDDSTFDAVISNLAVHHMGQPRQFLREARRVLRSGGSLAFTVWGDPAQLDAFGLFFAAVEKHGDSAALPHGPLFGISDHEVFRQMMREAGFRGVEVVDLPIVWRMTTIDSLLDGFADWADLPSFPQHVQTSIEADVRKASQAYRSGDELIVPNPAILVSGVK